MLNLPAEISGGEGQIRIELPGDGIRQLPFICRHCASLRLLSLELADHSVFPRAEKRRRLLLTGDSILQGMTTTSQ